MAPSKYLTTGEGVTATSPRKTSPVEPSMEIVSPSATTVPSWVVNRPALVSTSSDSAPQTHVRPMPRATTAACEVLPPRLVRMPRAATMPWRSSGVVSRRTRMTSAPASARRTAVSESNTASPTAAPGDALIPTATGTAPPSWSKWGNISWASWSPVTRSRASSSVSTPSSSRSFAMRKEASAVRFPTRVWSIHRCPSSMVNSMSHMSR